MIDRVTDIRSTGKAALITAFMFLVLSYPVFLFGQGEALFDAVIVTSYTAQQDAHFTSVSYDSERDVVYLGNSYPGSFQYFFPSSEEFREVPGSSWFSNFMDHHPVTKSLYSSLTAYTGNCDYCFDEYLCTGWGFTDVTNSSSTMSVGYNREVFGMEFTSAGDDLWLLVADNFNQCSGGGDLGPGLFLVQAKINEEPEAIEEIAVFPTGLAQWEVSQLTYDADHQFFWSHAFGEFQSFNRQGNPLVRVAMPAAYSHLSVWHFDHFQGELFWIVDGTNVLYLVQFPIGENTQVQNWYFM